VPTLVEVPGCLAVQCIEQGCYDVEHKEQRRVGGVNQHCAY